MEITLNLTEIILVIVVLLLIIILVTQSKFEIRYETKASKKNDLEQLSPTEYKILELLSGGKSNKEIASEMSVSIATVKKHITSIFKKLNISKRGEARKYFSHFMEKKNQST